MYCDIIANITQGWENLFLELRHRYSVRREYHKVMWILKIAKPMRLQQSDVMGEERTNRGREQ